MGHSLLSRNCIAAGSLAMVLLAPMRVDAQQQFPPQQMALLPPYCPYTFIFRDSVPGGNDQAQKERWISTLGGMFSHMHHYCFGLMNRNDAKFARTKAQRLESLRASIPQFDYVLRESTPDFVLLPEILTMKGESLIGLGQPGLAMTELQRAITLKPDYWPPYVAISDYYKDAGEFAKAREWLEKGLSFSPNTKALQNRLAELDAGKGKRKPVPQPAGESAEPPAAKPPIKNTARPPEPKPEAPGER